MNYPNHLIDPRKKGKEFISQYIRAAYDEFQKLFPNGFFNAADKYHMIDQYMKGRQSVTKYQKTIDPMGSKNKDQSWLNMDWSILPIVPKYRRMGIEMMNKQLYDVEIEIVNSLGEEDKEKYYKKKEANILVKDALVKSGLEDKVPVLGMTKEDPQDIDELSMHMKYGYKHEYAIKMEDALQLVLNVHNSFDRIRELVREDLFDYGVGCIKEEMNENGYIDVSKVDIPELIVGYSKKENFSDTRHIGEVKEMTLLDIATECKGELNNDQLEDIAINNCGKHRNPERYDGMSFMSYRAKVLDLEFYSVNELNYEKRKNKQGNDVVGRSSKRKNKKTEEISRKHRVVYRGKWIVGTEYFYGCELATDMKRHKNNLCETSLSYHIIAPQIKNMQTYSLGEQLISLADQIQVAWYKMQNAILQSRPSGTAIDIAALLNVPLGSGGKKLDPMRLLDLFNQKGLLVHRGYDDEGKPLPNKPFESLKGGVGDEVTKWFSAIQGYMELIRHTLGFNEITEGSTPDPRTLKSVAALSVQSTNNSLNFLVRAEKFLVQEVMNDLTIRIHDVLSKGKPLEGYIKPLGEEAKRFFSIGKDATRYTYGARIVDSPTEEDKQRLQVRIDTAQQNKEITVADAIFVESFRNIKMANSILAYRVKKNIERQEAEQLRMIQENSRAQIESTQASEKAKQSTENLKHKHKMEQIRLNGQVLLAIEEVKTGARNAESLETTNREITKKRMETDSMEYINDLKNLLETNKT